MATAIDLTALAAADGPKVTLQGALQVGEGGTGTAYSGFDDVSAVFIEVKVALIRAVRGAPGMTLLIESSTDGNSWSTAETFTFGYDGTQTVTLESPADYLRVRWTTSSKSEWYIDHVTAAPTYLEAAGGGGSTPGAAIVRGPYSFAFDTPGINDGVAFYTPTVGDILYDVWYVVTTAFNGTTPFADVSQYTGSGAPGGLASGVATAHDLTVAASINNGGGPANATTTDSSSYLTLRYNNGAALPGLFTTADPLKLVVSQDGLKGGAAVGGSAGAGKVYIVTSTPVAFS